MPNSSFDIAQLAFWNNLVFWTLNGIGIVSVFVALSSFKYGKPKSTNAAAIFLALLMIFLLGWYPIKWELGTDRANYAYNYYRVSQLGLEAFGTHDSEKGFMLLNYTLGRFLDVNQYFVAIATIYVGNYFIAIKRICRRQVYWLLLAAVLSMGFVSYNTNTMRAGLALSFVMLALSMYPSKIKMLVCMAIAASIHNSSLIPSCMIMLCCFYSNTRLYYRLWLLAVPLSFVAGGFFNTLFSGIGDDSRSSYLTDSNDQYNIGFRIDFIIYSMVPMLVGAYYIFKRKFYDPFYRMLYNAYLLTNIFWILVIRANFSDRFAYLSWCMIPLVLIYPLLLRPAPVSSPNKWVATILFGEIVFRSIL